MAAMSHEKTAMPLNFKSVQLVLTMLHLGGTTLLLYPVVGVCRLLNYFNC